MDATKTVATKLPFELDTDERIIRLVRRHWIDLVPTFAVSIALLLLAIIFSYFYGRFQTDVPLPAGIVLLIIGLIGVIGLVFLVIGVYVYRRNILILTNLHLAQVEQVGLFNRRVSQLSFMKVQDVTGSRPGVLATILDFGDVEVQTAGEQEKFTFHNAPHPDQLAEECLQTHELCMREQAARGIQPAPD